MIPVNWPNATAERETALSVKIVDVCFDYLS
jgi:hypothetical protein